MNSFLSRLSVLFGNSKHCSKLSALTYGSMAAITIVLEELFECVVFCCPCEGHIAYGLTFLWFPTLLLFLPGILLERRLGRRKADEDSPQTPTHRYLKTLFDTLEAFIRVSIAPVAWLVLSFMQQRYYTCAYFGPPLESTAATTNTSDKCYFTLGARSEQLEERYKTRSQIIGWWLVVIAMIILFTSICIRRCINKGKHLPLLSVRFYHHVAAKQASEQFHIKVKELAKQKANEDVESLFQNANTSDYAACIKEVSEKLHAKYGEFLPPEIPPESTCYNTAVDQSDRPPQSSEMFSDQTDGDERMPLNNRGRRESNPARTHGIL